MLFWGKVLVWHSLCCPQTFFFSSSLSVILIFLWHICENNPRVSSASMNPSSCGPQIAAAEHFWISKIWFQTCKIIFGPNAKPGICLQDWIRSFSETPSQDSHVSSVFGSNRHSWFCCQLSLSKLWAKPGDLKLNARARHSGAIRKCWKNPAESI